LRAGRASLPARATPSAPTNRGAFDFTEHVPLALILLVIIELNGAPRALLHTLGVVLIAARIAHPFGLKPEFAAFVPARGLGAVATLLVTLVAIVVAIWQVI
jgi:uncharacterized membrane protein YecN with MAPEG domain